MAGISGVSGSMNWLFGSSRGSSSSSSSGINLSDYALIKNGSYKKLMKSYYSDSSSTSKISAVSSNKESDSKKLLKNIQNSAKELADSAKDLYKSNSKLFDKKTSTAADGTTTTDYDRDALYKAVKSFVDDYNDAIDAAGDSSNNSIARSGANIINNTKVYASALKDIGITIDSDDYSLSIDENKFKEADVNAVKSLFNGAGSYGYSTAVTASMMGTYAENAISTATYSQAGTYNTNLSVGSLLNSFV